MQTSLDTNEVTGSSIYLSILYSAYIYTFFDVSQ